MILWQNAASPLVVGDRVFLNCNVANQCLMAVQASDGKTLWSGQNDVMTHSSPVREMFRSFSPSASMNPIISFRRLSGCTNSAFSFRNASSRSLNALSRK